MAAALSSLTALMPASSGGVSNVGSQNTPQFRPRTISVELKRWERKEVKPSSLPVNALSVKESSVSSAFVTGQKLQQCHTAAPLRKRVAVVVKASTGVSSPLFFGQMPLYRRLPKPKGIAGASATAKSGTDDSSVKAVPDGSVSVILLAGGKGKRMGANTPKQYLPLRGQPIALYSFHTFSSMAAVGEIIVVCDPSYRDIFEEQNISTPVKFAFPGKERQDSVWSGLQEICETSKLACIHDSARPLVRTSDILKVISDAWSHGAAVLGVPCKATIKEAGGDRFVKKTLDRKTLWEMQTPQVIEPLLLRKGFELVERERLEVTDDVSIVEYLQHPVLITEGCYTNLKVTTPDDLLVAERILHQRST